MDAWRTGWVLHSGTAADRTYASACTRLWSSTQAHGLAILPRFHFDPVAKSSKGRTIGLAFRVDEVIGTIAQIGILYDLDEQAFFKFFFHQELRNEAHAHSMNRRFGQHGKQFQPRTGQVVLHFQALRLEPFAPCVWPGGLLQ